MALSLPQVDAGEELHRCVSFPLPGAIVAVRRADAAHLHIIYFRAFFQFALALAAAFGPALALRWGLGADEEWKQALAVAAALAGAAYYPMAMLLAGFHGHWTGAFRLPSALRAIRLLGRDYAVCVVLIVVSLGLTTALESAVGVVARLAGPWAGLAVLVGAVFLELGVYAAHMRALGLVFRAHRRDLGWVVR